jgi:hypothetical protein
MAEMTTYDDPRLDPSAYPLIVYVHVPKTAGTTVKRVLALCACGRGDVHRIMSDKAAVTKLGRLRDWIGGHVARDVLAENLIWVNRPME